jgi:hypothetical protein
MQTESGFLKEDARKGISHELLNFKVRSIQTFFSRTRALSAGGYVFLIGESCGGLSRSPHHTGPGGMRCRFPAPFSSPPVIDSIGYLASGAHHSEAATLPWSTLGATRSSTTEVSAWFAPPERFHWVSLAYAATSGTERTLRPTQSSPEPEVGVQFLSGYSKQIAIMHWFIEAGAQFLPNPFRQAGLAWKLREASEEIGTEGVPRRFAIAYGEAGASLWSGPEVGRAT